MIDSDEYILPTIYRGIKYRSRTEARWARFFVAAEINFAYEPETFSLKCGKYLPDFKLNTYGGIYVEVKGAAFTEQEKEKCRQLCELTKSIVVMLDGPPDFKCYNVFDWSEERDCNGAENCDIKNPLSLDFPPCSCGEKWMASEKLAILCTASCKHFPLFWYPGFEDKDGYFKPDDWYDDHANAIAQAQNERFGVYQ